MDDKKRLGLYRLDAQLGAGGMGIVYQATDESLGREVAIKVLHPHLLKDEEHKYRFRREARVHAKLMHPNIVTLLSLYEDHEQMALVMEMIHGKNLKDYLRGQENHDFSDLIRIAQAVLSGLKAAHHIGLVHRDLKPANVLIANTGEIKLMDFGLAKSAKGDDDLTQTGATVGSFRYMAPEQILNQSIDARTDLYAFGILLYQMVAGRLPFDANAKEGGEFAIMEKQVREQAVPPHELNPSIPLELSDLVLRLLSKSPDDRPVDCAEVQRDLTTISEHLSSHVAAPSFAKFTENATKFFDVKASEAKWKAVKKEWYNQLDRLPDIRSYLQAWRQNPRKSPLTLWGGGAGLMLLLSWFVVSLIGHTEQEQQLIQQNQMVAQASVVESPPPVVDTYVTPVKADEPPVEIKEDKREPAQPEVTQPKPSKVVKVAPKEPTPAAKPKTSAVEKSSKESTKPLRNYVYHPSKSDKKVSNVDSPLDHVGYKLVRYNDSHVDIAQPHEFNGHAFVYFDTLEVTKEKTFFTTFKKGWIRLYLDEDIHLKQLTIEQATVKGALFDGGMIKVEVQDERFKWHQLLKQEKHDISSPVNFDEKQLPQRIKGIRIRMLSSSPLTLGPIRLVK